MLIPTVIEKTSNKEYAYDLYSRLLLDRIIFISGEINDVMANIIVSELLYLDSINQDDISVYINSPGGSVTAGFAIYDTFNILKSKIKTICVGQACSMGAFLLSSGTKGLRYCLENSEVMIHQPLGGAKGQATEIKIACDHIMKTKNKLNKILAKNTGRSIDIIEVDTDRDFFMDAKYAVNYGIVDEILKK